MKQIEINSIDEKYYLDGGYYSKCYLIDDIVYKVLNDYIYEKNVYLEIFNKENLEKLHNLNSDHIIGPKDILITNNRISGYTTDYIDGKTLVKMDRSIKVKDVLEAYSRFKKDILKVFDKNKFCCKDIHVCNLLFDGEFRMIDLDLGTFENKSDIKKNIGNIENSIICSLLRSYFDIFANVSDTLLRNIYFSYLNNNKEFLELYLERLLYLCNDDDINLDDISNFHKKLIKR